MGEDKKSPDTNVECPAKVPLLFSARFGLAVVAFFGFIIVYLLRFNMSVAMVCMVNNTAVRQQAGIEQVTNASKYGQCPLGKDEKTSTHSVGSFVWDKQTQGLIFSSFFWGYLVTQMPGGWLALKFGGRAVYGYSTLVVSVLALLTPLAANFSYKTLIVIRVLQGLGEGVVFPANHVFWGNWAPPYERSKLVAFTIAGSQVGNIIVFPLSGFLCDSPGWPAVFYVMGSCGIAWFIFWLFFAYDTPEQHPRISKEELNYIEMSLRGELKTDNTIPWKVLFTSLPVWAIVINHTAMGWGFYTLVTNLPTFMREILHFDIKQNGLYSAMPWIACSIAISVSGIMADELRERKMMTTQNVRRLCNVLGLMLPGMLLVVSGYLGCDQKLGFLTLLVIGQCLYGFAYTSTFPNMIDIAPRYGGIIFGLSNTITTITGIISPYIVGLITTQQTQREWQIVFWISFCIQVAGGMFYNVFVSGEVQDWARNSDESSRISPPSPSTEQKKEKTNHAFCTDEFNLFETKM